MADNTHLKNAKLTMRLRKMDGSYGSTETHKVSPDQWQRICAITGGPEKQEASVTGLNTEQVGKMREEFLGLNQKDTQKGETSPKEKEPIRLSKRLEATAEVVNVLHNLGYGASNMQDILLLACAGLTHKTGRSTRDLIG
ncbi:hypothetical protein [Pseudovibrio sp. Tun.PSC04-5.I4]|uniref:hypothetical protein n=1 Tax=Pseudovibrio sp. Tun.PSC04-5.I4 TaxID=1798213 RepID=UPI00087E2D67|nr:hypothetical protein [Pseudovibrio sp. Tun.PSC04-5.I4]SDR08149.1 hypothetical protein SAMN04515695_2656 [Pseudovibrio sp. Tun.PSC04-5.I4]